MLFIEQPAGVGYSYSTNPNDYTTGDSQAVADMFRSVFFFFKPRKIDEQGRGKKKGGGGKKKKKIKGPQKKKKIETHGGKKKGNSFILSWLKAFPNYSTNDFYISSESYGMYVNN
ncbi:hypothetical protein RFI_27362 [Reticulomyxa filosa]|uniref:Uncharacterized protein n=1 Tax=Reticulomyxa filosa TaxID=46433 RepID=X6MAF9_RETFI|nr:hypothetical protein RFI_27362 [Reticulomyxa filosa]|eukprot:ETO10015.1 hypothetical protein RFI_27362 [Reticulomyxa filosa]